MLNGNLFRYWIFNPTPWIQTDKDRLKTDKVPLSPALSPLKRGESAILLGGKGEGRGFRGNAPDYVQVLEFEKLLRSLHFLAYPAVRALYLIMKFLIIEKKRTTIKVVPTKTLD
jgi:hypothetical protein